MLYVWSKICMSLLVLLFYQNVLFILLSNNTSQPWLTLFTLLQALLSTPPLSTSIPPPFPFRKRRLPRELTHHSIIRLILHKHQLLIMWIIKYNDALRNMLGVEDFHVYIPFKPYMNSFS